MSVSEEYVKTLRKNGDVKTARRYEEGLYNSLGAIDFDVLDNLLAEVKRLRELLLPRIDEGYTTSYMDLRGIIEDVHWELTGDDHESNEERIKHALIALRDVIE